MKKPPTLPKPRSLPTKHRAPPKPGKAPARPSNILDHNYCAETGRLTITFHGGRKYRYEDVGKDDAEAFEASENKGRFLNSHIIGRFGCTKIED